MSTIRQQMIALLESGDHDAREISQLLSISEKEVYTHISHIEKTVSAKGKKLIVIPPSCLVCGYAFAKRRRPGRPGKCPRCRSERITNPRFSAG
jgi:transcriptional regulator